MLHLKSGRLYWRAGRPSPGGPTHLARPELAGHAESFGAFHVAFANSGIRLLGGVPAIYIPQPLGQVGEGLDLLGNTIVHRIHEIQKLLDGLAVLKEVLQGLDEDDTIELEISEEDTRTFRADDLGWLLRALHGDGQEAHVLVSAIRIISSFFVPTEYYRGGAEATGGGRRAAAKPLTYYRQREWRIVGNILSDGLRVDRQLTDGEKSRLLEIDPEFFGHIIQFGSDSMRRVDGCTTISRVGNRPAIELIHKICVPREALGEAGDLLETYGLTNRLEPVD